MSETGTAEDPWQFKTPPLTSDFTMHRAVHDGRDVLVCTVGKTVHNERPRMRQLLQLVRL